MKLKKLNECVIASKISKTGCFLGKNRDRSYTPNVEIIHGVYPKFEYVIIHDRDTGYMEGVNATSGFAILNSALLNSVDFGKNKSDEGKNIMLALLKCHTLEDILESLLHKYPVYGNTMVATKDSISILEATPEKNALKHYDKAGDYVVRTNHGILVPEVGYQPSNTEDYLSSMSRLAAGEVVMDNSDNIDEFLSGISYPLYGKLSILNPSRTSNYLNSTAQIGIDMENKVFKFSNFPGLNNFKGIKRLGDESIKPIYKIVVEDVEPPISIPFLTWGLR